jgi:hypothetical protein
VVENLADQPFGEQVLHQHFIDGGDADVWIERLLAEREKAIEGGLELLVGLVGLGDFLNQTLGEFRHALLELIHGLLETVDLRFCVGVKLVEQRGQLLGIGQVDDSWVTIPMVTKSCCHHWNGDPQELKLGQKRPAVRPAGVGQELLKSRFRRPFMLDALIAVSLQRLVVAGFSPRNPRRLKPATTVELHSFRRSKS